MRPEISVQIPVKDGGENFRITLESLRNQDAGEIPWELIVIDDGSSVPVEQKFDLTFPEEVSVKVIRRETSGNRPAARNRGWQEASAPLSFISDGDIRFPSDILRKHLEMHREGYGDVIMGARINAWKKDSSPWQKWFDTRAMGNREAGRFPPRYFITGNLSLPTELLESTGGFDPRIDRYGGEDTELGFRLAGQGATFYWDPDLRVDHLDTVTVREHSRKMIEYGSSGLKYTLKKIPESSGMLGSGWIKPLFDAPAYPGTVLMRLVTKIALLPPVYRCVLAWMEKAGAPRFLFTYLSVGACLMGLTGKDFEKQ
ncbi:MAG: glycosyltransferase [Candidatus Aegiribacteria sp.]|nr:glycosyltransferase [Candidatus Aegiribacteria sp.]